MWFISLLLLPVVFAQECDSGWKRFRRNCYKYVNDKNTGVNYGGAVAACGDLGAHLSSVTSLAEMEFIASIVPPPTSNSKFSDLPLLAMVKIDKWRNPFNWNEEIFEQWCKDEPNNSEGVEQCVSLGPEYSGPSSDNKPCLFDVNCDGRHRWERPPGYTSFVCKKAVTSNTKKPSTKIPRTTTPSSSGCTDPNAEMHDGGCVCKENYVDITRTDAPEGLKYKEGEWCIPEKPCENVKDLSVNFIVDSSVSIEKDNWTNLTKFLQYAADLLPKEETTVSFVKFSDKVTAAKTLKRGWTKRKFINFIPKKYDKGNTNTPAALVKATEMFQEDSSKHKVALLITDGEPKIDGVDNDNERLEFIQATIFEAEMLRSNDLSLVAFGFGPLLKREGTNVIRQLVEDPEKDFFGFGNNATDLTAIHMNILMDKVCSRFLP